MNKRRELVREFARTYFRINLHALARVPHEVHEQVEHLKTIVVDTAHLTDGSQTVMTTWMIPGMTGSTADTAHRATISSLRPLLRGLRRATVASHTSVKPAYTASDTVEWSAWHHGEVYELTAAGSIEEILIYCDLADNEREQITMQARKLSRDGLIVYATARGLSDDTTPAHGSLMFDGLVACKLHLLPGTTHAMSQLRTHGIQLVYMTSEPEDLATYVAHGAHITEHPKAARHGRYVSSTEHVVYARVNRINARKIVAMLPQPIIIARDPLATLVQMLDACR